MGNKEELVAHEFMRLCKFYRRQDMPKDAALHFMRFLMRFNEERIVDAIPKLMRYKSLPSIYQMERVFEEQGRAVPAHKLAPKNERPALEMPRMDFDKAMIALLADYYNGTAKEYLEASFKFGFGKECGRKFEEVFDEYLQKYSRADVEKLLYEYPRTLN